MFIEKIKQSTINNHTGKKGNIFVEYMVFNKEIEENITYCVRDKKSDQKSKKLM